MRTAGYSACRVGLPVAPEGPVRIWTGRRQGVPPPEACPLTVASVPTLVVSEPVRLRGVRLPLTSPEVVIGHSASADLDLDEEYVGLSLSRHGMTVACDHRSRAREPASAILCPEEEQR